MQPLSSITRDSPHFIPLTHPVLPAAETRMAVHVYRHLDSPLTCAPFFFSSFFRLLSLGHQLLDILDDANHLLELINRLLRSLSRGRQRRLDLLEKDAVGTTIPDIVSEMKSSAAATVLVGACIADVKSLLGTW